MSESMADDVDARAAAAATGDAGRASGLAEGGQPPAVKGGATISVAVVLLAVLVASVAALLVSSVPRAGDGVGEGAVGKGMQGAAGGGAAGEAAGKRAEPVEQALGGDVGIPGFNSRLDAFRAWARLTWMKLRRPRSDEPRYDADAAAGSAGSVAGAAKKSFEMGKETVEQAAATAARATGDAVEATKEKVKGAGSPSSSDSEL
ncbi:uncharacterized protein LOC101757961 [Setaria italica]|uniref:uncharacterized protein LOC101757961 n=1 Tax=Setaria italica TaxID=4555 RepID=UPI000BE54978|nr:uncharacterized protein LOC101757961 [Setaria italica]